MSGDGPSRWRRRNAALLGVATFVAVLVAGSAAAGVWGDEPEADDRRARATAILDHASGTGEVPAASAALREQVATAEGLRVGLRLLLGRHVAVTARTLDGAVAGSPDLEADARALRSNSQALAAAVALAYGDAGGRAFDELWSQHARLLVADASAARTGDAAASTAARAALGQYHADFTSFCALATDIPASAVDELVGDHLALLLEYTDAVTAGDRVRSSEILDRALTEIVPMADALAADIVDAHAEEIPGDVDDVEATRAAAATTAVVRTTSLLVEGARTRTAVEVAPPLEVPGAELGVAWSDLVAALATDGPATSAGVAQAAVAEGVPDDHAVALVDAVDVWVAALAAHRTALELDRGPASTEAATRAERAAVDVAAAWVAIAPG